MLLHQSSAVPNSYPVLIVQQRFVFASVKMDPWCIEDMYVQPDPYFFSTIDGREFHQNRSAINICHEQRKVPAATAPAATPVVHLQRL
jgi:hypothetical protein